MKTKLIDGTGITNVYISVILGAGFASGKEIETFFVRFGNAGYLGIILAGLILSAIILVNATACSRHKTGDMIDLSKQAGRPVLWLTRFFKTIFLPILFFVMMSGSGTICEEVLKVNYFWGSLLTSLLCFLVLIWDKKNVRLVNLVITPIVVISIIYICYVFKMGMSLEYKALIKEMQFNPKGLNLGAVWSSLLFVGYSVIVPLSLSGSFSARKKSKKAGILGGITYGMVVILMALLVCYTVSDIVRLGLGGEVPMLVAASSSSIPGFLFPLALWLAMFSSTILTGKALADLLEGWLKLNRIQSAFLACTFGFLMAQCGFSWLISNLYPALGIGGLLLILGQIPAWFRLLKKKHA